MKKGIIMLLSLMMLSGSAKEAVSISQPTISKTGDSDGGDNCSFYGVNAALLVKDGSTTTIKANGHHLWVNGKEMNIQ
jgi:hypothetical protein